ncbi:YodC family protein [Cronobacter dublinensis]|uniref:YodC family protein n=1 Tax=Cronobacter dublinensis TaxID=413497 RepID=UPI002894C375|nr:DUF2158 domain-containing protein [Cronobacter dublinensis]MDT3608025.1 DUF2158 domain-containing protein [Cronobacter dublinensis]
MAKAPHQTSPKFKIGDLVILKSGGPSMTVQKAILNLQNDEFTGLYQCQWFAGKKLETGKFPEDSLEPYIPKPQTQTSQP